MFYIINTIDISTFIIDNVIILYMTAQEPLQGQGQH